MLICHKVWAAPDHEAFVTKIAPSVRAIAAAAGTDAVDARDDVALPKLEIVSSFSASGYESHRRKWAGEPRHPSSPTTPDVLNEEVADTPSASASCSAPCAICRRPNVICAPANGRSTATYQPRRRCATVPPASSHGAHRQGDRRAASEAMHVPVVYHTRRRSREVAY